MRRLLRDLLFLGLAAALIWLFLPERFAANVPFNPAGINTPDEQLLVERVSLPEGFRLNIFADDLAGARMLEVTDRGDLLVSQPAAGRVVLLMRDDDADGRTDGRVDLLSGLDRPHGLDTHDGRLYVAEAGVVGAIRFDSDARATAGAYRHIVTGLPRGGNHWSRSVRIGPDNGIYVSVGSSCNACIENDPRRGAILRFNPDGSGNEIFASGLRNTVGFDWRPDTGLLYAVDNGRDLLGDDFPPCELNVIEQGEFYGWPFANGDRVPDPDLGAGREMEIRESVAPVHGFAAHTAPLGMSFVQSNRLPENYRGALLVALHGSWNRTERQGYEVVSLHFRKDGSILERKFASGFEIDEDVIGRPVDVAEGSNGEIYISDDYSGRVYRVIHQ
ncbi:MAG: PQQ-dependent sugar dehydrogenase [Gammaproteobacteria bacterium]|nr:PQQ-dependent sugar dehydrogenase [Gammaproteobacteria bacterium]MDE0512589.1 PQQ-dependent sugar dehydrogenase [Gammaproteobacteria bacterium]